MSWQYRQSTGALTQDGMIVAAAGVCYSGYQLGKNNPAMQDAEDVGPIPCGLWRIGEPYTHPKLGPLTMDLTPLAATETFGRTEFRMHGDGIGDPGEASHGCIVMPHFVRQDVAESDDTLLEVIP